ncbi:MAG TPA: sigma-70 family RNA polymerase sigma factor [Kofleriaceae bacterium]|jgi:RNA polymerase sigma-70 factor (ECF subfamily)
MSSLADQFDENRSHLRSVAVRILGTTSDADDALQEAWMKVGAVTRDPDNPRAWLTTVVARVCLDMLRARKVRTHAPLEEASMISSHADTALADEVGPALLIVLETLAPPERVAFVLHDLFDMSFEEIAVVLDKSLAAVRQLASRGRRRVRGAAEPIVDRERRAQVVTAFLAASRDGNFDQLLAVLSPEVVLYVDPLAVRTAEERKWAGAPKVAAEVRGAAEVAEVFKGRAKGATAVLIDGEPGAVWMVNGAVKSAFVFTLENGMITGIDLVMEPVDLAGLDVVVA